MTAQHPWSIRVQKASEDSHKTCASCRMSYAFYSRDRHLKFLGRVCMSSVEDDVQRYSDWRKQLWDEGFHVEDSSTCGNWTPKTP